MVTFINFVENVFLKCTGLDEVRHPFVVLFSWSDDIKHIVGCQSVLKAININCEKILLGYIQAIWSPQKLCFVNSCPQMKF